MIRGVLTTSPVVLIFSFFAGEGGVGEVVVVRGP